jgi:hypothetical protein
MSLDWNTQKCVYEGSFAYTETLIFSTMSVGMGRITEKNVEEFVRRILIYQEVFGPLLTGPIQEDGTIYEPEDDNAELPEGVTRGKISMTADIIRQHVGMTTNVADISKAKFKGYVMRWLDAKIEKDMK